MELANQICPICEEINSRSSIICRSCGQDMRVSPLNDYVAFVSNTPDARRNELSFQFGTLKHKLKISFDAIKHLLLKNNYDKTNTVFNYYRTLTERERSTLCYYMLLFSRKLFVSYYGLLLLDCHVYFTLIHSLLGRTRMISYTENPEMFAEGIRLVNEQKNKLVELIDEIIDQLEMADECDCEEEIWTSPPPPPTTTTFLETLDG